MEDAQFTDGLKQALYFEPGHPRVGLFKGMTILLEEQGMIKESKLLAQCKDFKCADKKANCCQCRTLYNQLNFVHIKQEISLSKNPPICLSRHIRCSFLMWLQPSVVTVSHLVCIVLPTIPHPILLDYILSRHGY
jgi:hypothetical protein